MPGPLLSTLGLLNKAGTADHDESSMVGGLARQSASFFVLVFCCLMLIDIRVQCVIYCYLRVIEGNA